MYIAVLFNHSNLLSDALSFESQHLNLRLNRLGDEGGQAICRALLKNRTLVDVNLGSNDLVEPTAAILSQVVMQNQVIRSLDLSCNRLGPVSIKMCSYFK